MNAFCLASAAGAAILALLAGCGQPASPPATDMQTVAALPDEAKATAAAPEETLAAADPEHAVPTSIRKHRGGAFGVGIRPTGSSANGITP